MRIELFFLEIQKLFQLKKSCVFQNSVLKNWLKCNSKKDYVYKINNYRMISGETINSIIQRNVSSSSLE